MQETESRGVSSTRRRGVRTIHQSLAGLLVLLLAVAVINHSSSNAQRISRNQYDGVTLFRGLFFGSGPIVSRVPTLGRVAAYFPAEYKNLESQVIKSIQSQDPGFFDRFARE